jgi:hypothetical protein
MNERERLERLAEYQRQYLDECRGRQFARKTFASYPSLRSIGPEAWDEQDAYHVASPYTGQEYDAEKFEVVEAGWDHEHCHVCNAHIEPGDEYWQSDEPHPLELCLACYQHLSEKKPI